MSDVIGSIRIADVNGKLQRIHHDLQALQERAFNLLAGAARKVATKSRARVQRCVTASRRVMPGRRARTARSRHSSAKSASRSSADGDGPAAYCLLASASFLNSPPEVPRALVAFANLGGVL
jgi:hypothetical protein